MPKTILPPRRAYPPEPAPNRKRWTRRDCEFLVQSELLTGRFELIDGEIISKMGQKPPHAYVIRALMVCLTRLFGGEHIACQSPIDVAREDRESNEPEPDLAVTAQPYSAYRDRHPGPADLRLVVEVSDTTLRFDLRTKAALYARAGITEYWVVDIAGRRIVAHRQPMAAKYHEILEYAETETISPLAQPDAAVQVADLLPPVE